MTGADPLNWRRQIAYFVEHILCPPAQAPLRSLTRPSLATLLTLSQRSLRFDSHLLKVKRAHSLMGADPFNLAEVDENRTHRGRDTPPIGFEDRERHQSAGYLLKELSKTRLFHPDSVAALLKCSHS